jgi:hypothetical protein
MPKGYESFTELEDDGDGHGLYMMAVWRDGRLYPMPRTQEQPQSQSFQGGAASAYGAEIGESFGSGQQPIAFETHVDEQGELYYSFQDPAGQGRTTTRVRPDSGGVPGGGGAGASGSALTQQEVVQSATWQSSDPWQPQTAAAQPSAYVQQPPPTPAVQSQSRPEAAEAYSPRYLQPTAASRRRATRPPGSLRRGRGRGQTPQGRGR